MYIDAHAHILSFEYGENLGKVIESVKNDREIILVNDVGYDLKSSEESVNFSSQYEFIFSTVGIHPYDADKFNNNTLKILKELTENKKVIAIGEIGLDYYRKITDFALQKKVFELQLILAKELGIPFMIHSRDAYSDTIKIIKKIGYFNGVFHSFDYGTEEIEEIIDLGLYVSFSGMLTFKKKEKLREAAKVVPIEKVLMETDSPFLAPVPMRGKTNMPIYVKYVYKYFANLKSTDEKELHVKIIENFEKLFGRSKIYLENIRRQKQYV